MTPNMPLEQLLGALRRNADLPDHLAEATPPQVYCSSAFLEHELDRIFNTEWVCVGREDQFAAPGAYRTAQIGRDPVIVLRASDGALRAMSNVCRHRMMSLLEGEGVLSGRISCPYHAWTYHHDGRLIGAPHMRENFDKSACRLPQFAVEVWQGWVFVSLDPAAEPLAPRLAPLARTFEAHDLASYQSLFRVEEVWQTNWKILAQNFMEGYHLSVVHPETVAHVLPTERSEAVPGGAGYSLYVQRRNPGVAYEYGGSMENPNPNLPDDDAMKVYLFSVFPCLVASVSPERTFWMSLQPQGVDRVKVLWGVDFYPGAMPQGAAAARRVEELTASFRAINDEDKRIVSAIARNARALAAEPGRLSPKEDTIWDFQRYLARMLCPRPGAAERSRAG